MKKVISISLTCLMLLALLHFSVATHYCTGNMAASKVSLSGKLATCGMEKDENEVPRTGSYFITHCCDNMIFFYGISGNYFPSLNFIPESFNNDFQVFSISANLNISSVSSFITLNTSVNPPGMSDIKSVDLSYICVYRI